MRFLTTGFLCLSAAVVLVSTDASAGTSSKQKEYATSYQINPAHSGNVTFAAGFAPPLQQLWSVNIGNYYDTTPYPLIAEGKVFIVAYGNDVYALDALTGATVWEHLFSGSGFTPAYDNGMLFLTDSTGRVTALSATNGKQKWSMLPSGVTSSHAPPIAVNGVVYTTGYLSSSTGVFGIDEATGQQLWWNLASSGDYSAPTYGDGGIYLDYPCNYFKFSAASGELLWHYTAGTSCYGSGATATYSGKRVYFYDDTNSVLNADDGAMLGSYPGPATPATYKANNKRTYMLTTANGKVYAIDVKRGTVAWSYALDGGTSGHPIVANGIALALSYDGELFALDGTTGKELWSGQAVGYGGSTSYLAAGQGVVAVSSDGTLAVFGPQ
jgi:outer membrane protein assembly factor BamB